MICCLATTMPNLAFKRDALKRAPSFNVEYLLYCAKRSFALIAVNDSNVSRAAGDHCPLYGCVNIFLPRSDLGQFTESDHVLFHAISG